MRCAWFILILFVSAAFSDPATNSFTGQQTSTGAQASNVIGSGGGGDGTYSLIGSVTMNGSIPASGIMTSSAITTTGGNVIVPNLAWYNGPSPSVLDTKNNTYSKLTSYGDTSTTYFNQFSYNISGAVGTSHAFIVTNNNPSASCLFVLNVEVWKRNGGTPAIDTSSGTNYTGANATILQCGLATPSGAANQVCIGAATWNTSAVTATGVTGFTISNQAQEGGDSLHGGEAYQIQTPGVAKNPTWNFSGNINGASGATVFLK